MKFSELLHSWPELKELSLGFNSISDTGVSAIVSASERGSLKKLERLYLVGNSIGEAGVAAVAGALRAGQLPSCSYINLAKNPKADECVWLIEELLKGEDGYLPRSP